MLFILYQGGMHPPVAPVDDTKPGLHSVELNRAVTRLFPTFTFSSPPSSSWFSLLQLCISIGLEFDHISWILTLNPF